MTHVAGKLTLACHKGIHPLDKMFQGIPQHHNLPIRTVGQIADIKIRMLCCLQLQRLDLIGEPDNGRDRTAIYAINQV